MISHHSETKTTEYANRNSIPMQSTSLILYHNHQIPTTTPTMPHCTFLFLEFYHLTHTSPRTPQITSHCNPINLQIPPTLHSLPLSLMSTQTNIQSRI